MYGIHKKKLSKCILWGVFNPDKINWQSFEFRNLAFIFLQQIRVSQFMHQSIPPAPHPPPPGIFIFFSPRTANSRGWRFLSFKSPRVGTKKEGKCYTIKRNVPVLAPRDWKFFFWGGAERRGGQARSEVAIVGVFSWLRLLICALAKRNYHLYTGYDSSTAILTLTWPK